MINITALQLAFYTWADGVVTEAVIWENENGPRPSSDYVGLMIPNVERIGQDSRLPPDDTTGGVSIIGDRDCLLEITGIGASGYTNVLKLADSLELDAVLLTLRTAGIVIVDTGPALDTSVVLDSLTEQRGFLTITFRVADVIPAASNIVGIVEEVQASPSYGGFQPAEIEIEIP